MPHVYLEMKLVVDWSSIYSIKQTVTLRINRTAFPTTTTPTKVWNIKTKFVSSDKYTRVCAHCTFKYQLIGRNVNTQLSRSLFLSQSFDIFPNVRYSGFAGGNKGNSFLLRWSLTVRVIGHSVFIGIEKVLRWFHSLTFGLSACRSGNYKICWSMAMGRQTFGKRQRTIWNGQLVTLAQWRHRWQNEININRDRGRLVVAAHC